jgi:tRNA A-37 threonylcarbamoyl transferase component Bud32
MSTPILFAFLESNASSKMGLIRHRLGYLFMEYVPGSNLKDLDLSFHEKIVSRVGNVIAHLGQISGGHVP